MQVFTNLLSIETDGREASGSKVSSGSQQGDAEGFFELLQNGVFGDTFPENDSAKHFAQSVEVAAGQDIPIAIPAADSLPDAIVLEDVSIEGEVRRQDAPGALPEVKTFVGGSEVETTLTENNNAPLQGKTYKVADAPVIEAIHGSRATTLPFDQTSHNTAVQGQSAPSPQPLTLDAPVEQANEAARLSGQAHDNLANDPVEEQNAFEKPARSPISVERQEALANARPERPTGPDHPAFTKEFEERAIGTEQTNANSRESHVEVLSEISSETRRDVQQLPFSKAQVQRSVEHAEGSGRTTPGDERATVRERVTEAGTPALQNETHKLSAQGHMAQSIPLAPPLQMSALAESATVRDVVFDVQQHGPFGALGTAEIEDQLRNTALERGRVEHTAARPIINQIVQTITKVVGEGSVELRLQPEELGRVRLTMQPVEGGVSVQVSAERAETLDLLRRNIDMLESDLKKQGFSNMSFAFGSDSSDDAQMSRDDDGSETRNTSVSDNQESSEVRIDITATPLDHVGRLDIRV